MERDELKYILRTNGGFSLSVKHARGKPYLSACKKIPGTRRNREIHLCAASKLEQMTAQQIVERLNSYADRQKQVPGELA